MSAPLVGTAIVLGPERSCARPRVILCRRGPVVKGQVEGCGSGAQEDTPRRDRGPARHRGGGSEESKDPKVKVLARVESMLRRERFWLGANVRGEPSAHRPIAFMMTAAEKSRADNGNSTATTTRHRIT
jgi:hypothetical protein